MRGVPIDRIVVINDLARPMGGASALALASARAFRAQGHAVTLLAGDTGDDGSLAAAGIACVALGQGRLLSRPRIEATLAALWNRSAARMVSRWIATHDTPRTVYHLHGWLQILSPAVFHALAPVRDRLVISAHDFFLACPNGAFADLKTGRPCPLVPLSRACVMADCDRHSRSHKLLRVVRHAIQTRVFDPAHAPPVLAIHAAMAPLLARAGIPADAIHALPNPVEPWSATRIPAEENREVLFVGRLEETKGPDLAAAAARAAGVPLRLVGSGAMEPMLRARHPEARFSGRLSPAEIARVARRARLLVMPSRYPEPYGLVAMEAARSGLSVILPGTALLADDMVRHGAGVAIDPRDTAGFAQHLAALAQDDARVRAMSEAAFALPDDLALSPNAWIARLLDFYAARLAASAVSGGPAPYPAREDECPATPSASASGVWPGRGRTRRARPSSTAELAAGARLSRSRNGE
ncbi:MULTISPECIES: glycosyltransferase family 4 protein [unclassified Novosphingobium]|uniref:glycosyltransferase family 4 protein n=1 Tax=unclassified Novosphingobium TaxID=2644732 RepID=UPI00146EABD8|nr:MULTISPECIES: glycosyltransferase family 4 protein [unclassified Novosphingobium]NMN03564.1 glycosyltransferase involved in cell wall biosynthesis [Novosphingobium sp. SG919]NMN86446.1 glycosyltransferase involved in cell wall biosynthesis [Novosphingobium sp. SG916]